MYLQRCRLIAQQFIDHPPKSGVELDTAIQLHLNMSIELKMLAVLFGVERADIAADLETIRKLWDVIEVGLQTQFEAEGPIARADGSEGCTVYVSEDEDDLLIRPPVLRSTFICGNATLH